MNIQFHKQSFKVFLVILLLEGCLLWVTSQGHKTIVEIKRNAVISMFGQGHADCLELNALANRFESIGNEELEKRANTADDKVRNVNFAIVIIALGLSYLASCMIIRILRNQDLTSR